MNNDQDVTQNETQNLPNLPNPDQEQAMTTQMTMTLNFRKPVFGSDEFWDQDIVSSLTAPITTPVQESKAISTPNMVPVGESPSFTTDWWKKDYPEGFTPLPSTRYVANAPAPPIDPNCDGDYHY